MPASLKNIFLFVTDLARAKAFYADMLGLPLAGQNEMMMEFFPGAVTTMTVTLAFHDEALKLVGGHTGITLSLDDVEGVCARLQQAGITFIEPFEKNPWGKMAVVADPDGNQLRLWSAK